MPKQKKAIIIGAGPAGLTAAYELLKKTDIIPVVYEMSNDIGGISKTVVYKGNRMDIGGHRFFSKSDRVMEWWQNMLLTQGKPSRDDLKLKRKIPLSNSKNAPDPEKTDRVMLVRSRLSRIFFLRKFFDYPVSLSKDTIKKIGFYRMSKIGLSYFTIKLRPIKKEESLEHFFINRFGKELYETFFKDYTEKLWGVPCSEIEPDWGAQRVKGLSISKAVKHALKQMITSDRGEISQNNVETSLIGQFLYPKLGPGQLWEIVAHEVEKMGGKVIKNSQIVGLKLADDKIKKVTIKDKNGNEQVDEADYVFSTMPVCELIEAMGENAPDKVKKVAKGLAYRDFITVGLLLKDMKIKNETHQKTINNIIPDTWVYVQERTARMCRFQVFNNWSPYLVKDPNTIWLGLEYVCSEKDDLWKMSDEEFADFAIQEMVDMNIIDKKAVIDHTVVRVKKTYPAYFGTYKQFGVVKNFVNKIDNLYLIGRNGMHRYNNTDHSMLTAMEAVENIISGRKDKENIWNVNAEEEYHEEK